MNSPPTGHANLSLEPGSAARYQPPRSLAEYIERPELEDLLHAQALGTVTVISGPHGSGKTTLLQAVYRQYQQQGLSPCWLSLSAEDNDPQVLRQHLTQAFDLATGEDTHSLSDMPPSTVAFIDGLEQLSDPATQALAQLFMLSLPESARLFTSTVRVHGALLGNGRLRGLVNLIEPAALRFSDNHAQCLLGNGYNAHEAHYLNHFVEGWAAGLRFLQQSPDYCRRLLNSRQADSLPAAMYDYFDQHFTATLSADTLHNLMQLSVFEHFSSALLAQMPPPTCHWQAVQDAINLGLFLDYREPTREWVTFHPAFALYLRTRLRHEQPERFAQLKLFVAQWMLNTGHYDQALRHATGLACKAQAAQLIEAAGGITQHVKDGSAHTLQSLVPPEQAADLPLLFLSQVYQRIRLGRFLEARLAFDQAWAVTFGFSQITPESGVDVVQGWAYMVETVLRVSLDTSDYADFQPRLHQDTLRHLEREPVLAASLASVLGFIYTEQGAYEQALNICSLGLQVQKNPETNRASIFLLLHQSRAHLGLGHLRSALVSTEQALQCAQAEDASNSYEVLSSQAVHATVLYELGQLDHAHQLLQPVLEHIRQINGWMSLYADVFNVAAAIEAKRSGLEAAERILHAAERFADERQYVRLSQLMLITRLNELRRAKQWPRAMEMLESPRFKRLLADACNERYLWAMKGPALLACAEFYLEMGRPHECLAHLEPLNASGALPLDSRSQLQLQLLAMRARFTLRRFNAAFEHLCTALQLLREGDFLLRAQEASAYLLEIHAWARRQGKALPHELEQWLKTSLPSEAMSPTKRSPDASPKLAANFSLSPRETEIISLIAQGWINKEIAAQLGISEGTVKGHRKSIHEKLGVSSRSQAISRARELLLI